MEKTLVSREKDSCALISDALVRWYMKLYSEWNMLCRYKKTELFLAALFQGLAV